MKAFILICLCFFLIGGCVLTSSSVKERLDICVSELEDLEALHTRMLNPYVGMAVLKHEKTIVLVQIFLREGLIVRYCYLDQGEVVGFALNKEIYQATQEKQYDPDVLEEDEIAYICEVIDKVNRGIDPFVGSSET